MESFPRKSKYIFTLSLTIKYNATPIDILSEVTIPQIMLIL